jgi:FKBP-type peptidyl-prolyl cis-trans isomerase FkpA
LKTIAIAGATGYIGGRLTPRLLDSGYRVRCLVRTPEKLRDRHWSGHPNLEVCPADLNSEADLASSLRGCDAAFYLVHSMMSAGAGYAKQDNELALHFARAAAQAAPPVTTASGLVYEELRAGQGEQPQASDTVRVHYVGTFADGREFDSSVKRGRPAEFPVARVIKCWTQGVSTLQVGSKARLTCPGDTAYGARGIPGTIPPNSTLVFEVELLGIEK